MTDFYLPKQDQAEKAIAKYGRTVNIISLVKSGPDYDPTITEALTPCKAVQSIFTTNEIDGTLVRADDKKFLIAGNVNITTDMLLKDGDKKYSIVRIMEVKPGDVLILSNIQARL